MELESDRRIVVGVDGSAHSLGAVDVAAAEAVRRDAPLHVLHVVTTPTAGRLLGRADRPEMAAAARPVVDRAIARAREGRPALAVTSEVAVGGPAEVLIGESAEAVMTVVGCRGLGGFAGLRAGSVSAHLAAHGRGPVVVVRPGAPALPRPPDAPVVVGVDGDAPSLAALEFAFAEAAVRGVQLRAVYAWTRSLVVTPTEPLSHDFAAAKEQAVRQLAELMAGWQERYPEVEQHRFVVYSSHPAQILVDASEHAGIVVVGSRGRGRLRAMLGSVGYRLIHQAHCPVVIAHARPAP